MCTGFSTIAYGCWCSPFTFRTDNSVLGSHWQRKRCLCGRTESFSRGTTRELKDRNTIVYISNKRAQTPLQARNERLISSVANHKYTTTNSFCPLLPFKNNFCQTWCLKKTSDTKLFRASSRHISPLSIIKTHSLIQSLLREGFWLPDEPHVICNVDKNPLRISLKTHFLYRLGPRFASKSLEAKILQHYKASLAACLPFLHSFTFTWNPYLCNTKKLVGYFRFKRQEQRIALKVCELKVLYCLHSSVDLL